MNKMLSIVPGLAIGLMLTGFTRTPPDTPVQLDDYTLGKIRLIESRLASEGHPDTGRRIDEISASFLGTPYVPHMLVGSATSAEKLVIDFRGLDCFTYLDYVEALRKSDSVPRFIENVVRTRYEHGDISYLNRKHFFTDWAHATPLNARDVTRETSSASTTVTKVLRTPSAGGQTGQSGSEVTRAINYIPSQFVDEAVISRLHTGDYIGIYTPAQGLDVTHTGIFIMTDKGPVLRNASAQSSHYQVIDSPFLAYVKKTPGIVVLRAL
ncbi:N-acetylmuramoyl-L-alanine amidase-like domain-containing protein [Pseudomonas asplenii]|uniref:N-acetylmuramoyl-L-alanine amidase-like domain-containing protein n=1 Tax=Pseudomonas asplenii TaxID=53407 RepID=UPI00035E1FD4|nr:N-acetylmuramoyl-L-alanine amidase-like domain-containing protein [Pseudomonas fuscovaginae]